MQNSLTNKSWSNISATPAAFTLPGGLYGVSAIEGPAPNQISHIAMPDLPSSARCELAVVHDYDGLRIALRARAEQLDISRLEIDRISGVANGYSSAVLSNTPRKRIGPANLGPLLAALGLKLVVVEDLDMMVKYTSRAEKRVPNMAHLNNHNARRTTARG